MNVRSTRYQCVGCKTKIELDEFMRNLTQERFMQQPQITPEPVMVTSTIILCDVCKPAYDAINKQEVTC